MERPILRSIFCTLLLSFLIESVPAKAGEPSAKLSFPLSCTLGTDCWISAYPDSDPDSEGYRDYTCGARSYTGHRGTDFTITESAFAAGVDVLSAAAGDVLRIRDTEDDTPKTPEEFETLSAQKKDCGNGILIDHGAGFFTQYCHLKEGSLLVEPGDRVQEGQKIAQVGRSGNAELPHLHLSVLWEGAHTDPFTGKPVESGCGQEGQSLWKNPITYQPVLLHRMGFRDSVPDFSAIKKAQQNPKSLKANAKALTFWVELYGVMPGDQIRLDIRMPDGRSFVAQSFTQDEIKARKFIYTGRKLSAPLPPGPYTGTVFFTRPGTPPVERQKSVQIKIEE
jgi:hypothetical protein